MQLRDSIMDDVMAFWKSRVIITACDLDVFTAIDRQAGTAGEIADRLGLNGFAVERLLNSLAADGFLNKREGTFTIAEKGGLLSGLRSGSILPMVLHFSEVWKIWNRLSGVVKEGRQQGHQEHTRDKKSLESFIGAMDVIGRELSVEVARACSVDRFSRLLDIGGGSGTYTIAFVHENPRLRAVIFDLEPVTAIAEKRLKQEGLMDRVELVAGDFYRDELPGGCDCALLSAIIHQNSPEENLDLFMKIHRALLPGGTVIIRDHIMDSSRTIPLMGTLFALNMLLATPGGDTYTFDELRSALKTAGFMDVRLVKEGARMDGLIEARKA